MKICGKEIDWDQRFGFEERVGPFYISINPHGQWSVMLTNEQENAWIAIMRGKSADGFTASHSVDAVIRNWLSEVASDFNATVSWK